MDRFTVPKHCDDEFSNITQSSSDSLTTTNLQQTFDSSANMTDSNSTYADLTNATSHYTSNNTSN